MLLSLDVVLVNLWLCEVFAPLLCQRRRLSCVGSLVCCYQALMLSTSISFGEKDSCEILVKVTNFLELQLEC